MQDHAEDDEILGQLWREINTVPTWVDWEQIARGQDCFYRYGGPALSMYFSRFRSLGLSICATLEGQVLTSKSSSAGLAFQSLLGGMGATRVVETLSRTGGFSTKVARHRLLETTQHILQCTKSLESIQRGGEGFKSTLRGTFFSLSVKLLPNVSSVLRATV